MEPFDPARHDAGRVAALIYDADPEINGFVFGPREQAIGLILALMKTPGTYYAAPRLTCITSDGEVIGIVSGYPTKFQGVFERRVGKAFLRAFGLAGFLCRLPMFLKLGRILAKTRSNDGYYIVYLSILSTERGKGYGSAAVLELASAWETL
ncbi:MAG: hypothetical protein Q8N15_03720, partial [Bacillota bacterium]|nr:hypothetical protein [Bacillota bacterium]